MISDQTAKTSVFYTPYTGAIIPTWSGTAWVNNALSADLSLALDTTNHTSANLYDVFVWVNTGTLSIGTGPAWTNATTRSAAIALKNGIWTNNATITLKNGAGAGTAGVAANTATYVGTFYATANGQTGQALLPAAATGGTNNILGLYNAYNQVTVTALCRDNTASWSYATTTWRASDASNSNRVSWVDGLQQSPVQAVFSDHVGAGSGAAGTIGVDLDSTSATPATATTFGGATLASEGATLTATASFYPQIGFHFAQAVEYANGTNTFFGNLDASRQPHALSVTVAL